MIHFPDRIKMGDRIKEISELKENWDGCGAKSFSEPVIKRCRSLLSVLPCPMTIYAGNDDSVLFESPVNSKRHYSFKVYEDHISFYYVDAFSDTHLMPNVPQDYLIDFLKGICKDEKDTVRV